MEPLKTQSVQLLVGDTILSGDLTLPPGTKGVVLFAHGSGSSRHSPRNQMVAGALQEAGLGTLLMDLLSPAEEEADARSGHLRFNIGLLADRVVQAVDWLAHQPETRTLRIGAFGASTGAAAALVAAARRPGAVCAVVSRGGRPDLAADELAHVSAPTLLIVGGADAAVLPLNEQALAQLGAADKRMVTLPGATHLFEEPGALEQVARLASDWFGRCLTRKDSLQAA